jgi:ribosome-associated heat shock protein Hsp15
MDEQRLDKWLWCVRLMKTRSLAVDAIKAGRLEVNGIEAKPSRMIRPGDSLRMKQPPFVLDLTVTGIATQRVGASIAATLYTEAPESLAVRTALAERLRLGAVREDPRFGKLSKKDRRDREAFKRETWDDDAS